MSVVRDFCGHGLGRLFHDEPNIVHVGRPGEGVVLRPGMFFTVEPMINLGRPHVKVLSDGWTAVTRDRSLSAQFEHTRRGDQRRRRDLHAVAQGPRPAADPAGRPSGLPRKIGVRTDRACKPIKTSSRSRDVILFELTEGLVKRSHRPESRRTIRSFGTQGHQTRNAGRILLAFHSCCKRTDPTSVSYIDLHELTCATFVVEQNFCSRCR